MAYTKEAEFTKGVRLMVSPELLERVRSTIPPGERSVVFRRLLERETARRQRRQAAAGEHEAAA
jgi:hypothetical protein